MVNITGFNLPLTTITWMEDGQVLMNNTDNITITHGSFEAPNTTSTLVRDPIQSVMDNGTYEITVVNPAGRSMTTYTVIVNGKSISIVPSQSHTLPNDNQGVGLYLSINIMIQFELRLSLTLLLCTNKEVVELSSFHHLCKPFPPQLQLKSCLLRSLLPYQSMKQTH